RAEVSKPRRLSRRRARPRECASLMVFEDLARDSTASAGATNSGITVPHQVQMPRQRLRRR
ncbi:hypothetical protein, partial [Rhodococcus opacus]|uniref:hypothetical protein n=1 Tax=Rhodococcus opacus TaxID=37919 RepID=UPI001C7D0A91